MISPVNPEGMSLDEVLKKVSSANSKTLTLPIAIKLVLQHHTLHSTYIHFGAYAFILLIIGSVMTFWAIVPATVMLIAAAIFQFVSVTACVAAKKTKSQAEFALASKEVDPDELFDLMDEISRRNLCTRSGNTRRERRSESGEQS